MKNLFILDEIDYFNRFFSSFPFSQISNLRLESSGQRSSLFCNLPMPSNNSSSKIGRKLWFGGLQNKDNLWTSDVHPLLATVFTSLSLFLPLLCLPIPSFLLPSLSSSPPPAQNHPFFSLPVPSTNSPVLAVGDLSSDLCMQWPATKLVILWALYWIVIPPSSASGLRTLLNS